MIITARNPRTGLRAVFICGWQSPSWEREHGRNSKKHLHPSESQAARQIKRADPEKVSPTPPIKASSLIGKYYLQLSPVSSPDSFGIRFCFPPRKIRLGSAPAPGSTLLSRPSTRCLARTGATAPFIAGANMGATSVTACPCWSQCAPLRSRVPRSRTFTRGVRFRALSGQMTLMQNKTHAAMARRQLGHQRPRTERHKARRTHPGIRFRNAKRKSEVIEHT